MWWLRLIAEGKPLEYADIEAAIPEIQNMLEGQVAAKEDEV